MNLSLNQTLLILLLCVRQAWMTQLILAISCMGFKTADSHLCFPLALLPLVSYLFFLYQLPSLSLCMGFDSVSINTDEVLSINPSANVFVFAGFNVHHKDWPIYSGETD